MPTTSISSDSQANRYPNWKTAAMYVLAGLISNPLFYTDTNYSFDMNDFPEQFHKVVFGAVDHLIKGGMTKIEYFDIDNYLKPYAVAYKVFTDNRGIEYIQKALRLYDAGKFEYSYNDLKKYSLLAKLNADGIDTSDIYNPDILETRANAAMQAKFDSMTVSDILTQKELVMMKLRSEFSRRSSLEEGPLFAHIDDMMAKWEEVPTMGLPLTSPKLTTAYYGLRKGCFYIESADTGVGKSRHMAAESCHLAIPWYYDLRKKAWVNTGLRQRVLFISTELDAEAQAQMCISFISGVEQDKIRLRSYSAEEKARVVRAQQITKEYVDNLYFIPSSMFTAETLTKKIMEYVLVHQVGYVFFDYLMSNGEMLADGSKKMSVSNIREDMLLFDMATELKELAKTQHIMIWTATQLSGDISQAPFLDKYCIRGAKSIADKGDDCSIFANVRDVDKPSIEMFCPKAKAFLQAGRLQDAEDPSIPNAVFHIYKIRDGRYGRTKLYVHFDRGTSRMYDCFAVDTDGHRVDIPDTIVQIEQNGSVSIENPAPAAQAAVVPIAQGVPVPTVQPQARNSDDVIDDELPDFTPEQKSAPKVDKNGEVVLPAFSWDGGD